MSNDESSVYCGAELNSKAAEFWLMMDAWSMDEAALLLNAIDPAALNQWAARNGGTLAVRFPEQFDAVKLLLERAVVSGALPSPCAPVTVIAWAMAKRMRLPAPLIPKGAVARGGEWVKDGMLDHAAKAPAAMPGRARATAQRRDLLHPAIERAQAECADRFDPAAVWAELGRLAAEKVAPLIGATEDGIQFRKDGDVSIFTRKALALRLGRLKEKDAKAR